MRPVRVVVALLLLVTQFRPVAAALSCIYEEQVAAAACDGGMTDMGATGNVGDQGGKLTSQAHGTECGLASICAVPAPALLRQSISLVSPLAFIHAATARLSLLIPGDRAAPPTQPPRA